MDRTAGMVITVCVLMGGIVAMAAMAFDHERKKRKKGWEPPPPPPMPSRTSALAGFSFLCGLVAILLVTASAITSACSSMNEITGIPESARAAVDLAAKIVLYVSLLPAVGAAALALGARGSINESHGALHGRSLYRSALFLALVSGVLVFEAKAVNPANWVRGGAGGAGGAGGILFAKDRSDPNRGYLGVQHETVAGEDGIRVLQVLPGTPAERAGLKPGDRILRVNGIEIARGDSFADRIASLKPGSTVELSIRRGDELVHLTTVLTMPFAPLREMLEDASFDNERISILKAAGVDRSFTASELKEICETFSFDATREEAATVALPHLVDPQNAYQILPTFSFSSGKESMSRKIEALVRSKK
jgi:membrane-associated protease RseP (regulator of RpoE activity)